MPINDYEKRRLQRRDARIVNMRKTMTRAETAKRVRLTQERVRQIENDYDPSLDTETARSKPERAKMGLKRQYGATSRKAIRNRPNP